MRCVLNLCPENKNLNQFLFKFKQIFDKAGRNKY